MNIPTELNMMIHEYKNMLIHWVEYKYDIHWVWIWLSHWVVKYDYPLR